ncbi:MAG: NUDIX pyrophosphatase [Firmicutes bacterium]|nr:NUDIX pyrophosphatase [Bacillota bacterium]
MIHCIMVWLYQWLEDEPLYLLLKRTPDLGGYWQPVTGYIEPPETNRAAALRELAEETGIEKYEQVFDPHHFYFFDMNGKKCAMTVLAVEVKNPPPIRLSEEHTACQWLSYAEARRKLYWPNNKEALDILHAKLLTQGTAKNVDLDGS